MSQTNARLQGGAVIMPIGSPAGSVAAGEAGMVLESDGLVKLIDPAGNKTAVGAFGSDGVLARSQMLLGATVDTILGTDFDNSAWHRLATIAGAPTATNSATERGGVLVLDSSATANSTGVVFPAGATTIDIDNPQTSRWYAYVRAAFGTAVDAQALLQLFIATAAGGNPTMRLGIIGSASTAFLAWSVSNNAGSITASGTTTVAVDTNTYHDFEIWNDGTTVSFAVDRTVVATTPATNLGTSPVVLGVLATNGTTAASRTIKIDKRYLCCARP